MKAKKVIISREKLVNELRDILKATQLQWVGDKGVANKARVEEILESLK